MVPLNLLALWFGLAVSGCREPGLFLAVGLAYFVGVGTQWLSVRKVVR